MKGHADISNPYALANWMADKGYTPHKENGVPYDAAALYRRACHEGWTEANSASALGAVQRESARVPRATHLSCFSPFREAAATAESGTPQVVLITAGPGNRRDGNFYPPDVIQRDAGVFEGVKCFLNHPTRSEDEERPERAVQEISGWFSGVAVSPNTEVTALVNYKGDLQGQLAEAAVEMQRCVEAAIAYGRQYPGTDKVLLGFSINAEGPSHVATAGDLIESYPQYAAALALRDTWNVVDGIASAMSVDLVTFPARGGRVVGLTEAQRLVESDRWRGQFERAVWRAQFTNMLRAA
jgi:hypothetical protein